MGEVRRLFLPESASEILKLKVAGPGSKDMLLWTMESTGDFTVKSVFSRLRNGVTFGS